MGKTVGFFAKFGFPRRASSGGVLFTRMKRARDKFARCSPVSLSVFSLALDLSRFSSRKKHGLFCIVGLAYVKHVVDLRLIACFVINF